MSDTKTTRRDAARAVGLFLGTTQGRELFRRNHYLNETRILAVPESEPIDSVIADHLDHGADTIVAVFFPDRRGSKRFGFFRDISMDDKDLVMPSGESFINDFHQAFHSFLFRTDFFKNFDDTLVIKVKDRLDTQEIANDGSTI